MTKKWLSATAGIILAEMVMVKVRQWLDRRTAANTVLELDLTKVHMVRGAPTPFGQQFHHMVTIRSVVSALDIAAKDPKVSGLVLQLGPARLGMADLQELRDAILRFRRGVVKETRKEEELEEEKTEGIADEEEKKESEQEDVKFAVACADTFGEGGQKLGLILLASACSEVFVGPSGLVSIVDFLVEQPFVHDTLGKLGIEPRFLQRHEYKNFANVLQETKFTEAHREAVCSLVGNLRKQLLQVLADERFQGDVAEAEQVLQNGPYLPSDAQHVRLVDGVLYREEVRERVAERLGVRVKQVRFLYLRKYLQRKGSPYTAGTKVAYIPLRGSIHRGRSGEDFFEGKKSIGSSDVCAILRAAVRDRVRAIVLHIDSGGGSFTASDSIAHEVQLAKEKGIKVVAIMANVAASGGFYIAHFADRILAQPGTLTGSIGVVYGKFLTQEMWSKLGVTWDEVEFGPNGGLWSGRKDLTESSKAKFDEFLDFCYDEFTTQVARGRSLPLSAVQAVARGRVWTGEQALQHRLIDELGGFARGMEVVRELLGLEEHAKLHLQTFPKQKTGLQALLELLGGGASNSDEDECESVWWDCLSPAVAAPSPFGLFKWSPLWILSSLYSLHSPFAAAGWPSPHGGLQTAVPRHMSGAVNVARSLDSLY